MAEQGRLSDRAAGVGRERIDTQDLDGPRSGTSADTLRQRTRALPSAR